jgi:hypothetical protein
MTILERPTIEPYTLLESIPLDTDISAKRYRGYRGNTTGDVIIVNENGTEVIAAVIEGAEYSHAFVKMVKSGGTGEILGCK